MNRRFKLFGLALLLLAVLPAEPAAASQFVDVLLSGAQVTLRANGHGEAMVYYTKGSAVRHVFVRGAINARFPTRGAKQVHFKLDYSGGYNATGHALWKTFRNECQSYDGPDLTKAVAKCKAPDGSYWAVQLWRVALPDLGFPPWTVRQRSFDLRISHWTEPAAEIELHADLRLPEHLARRADRQLRAADLPRHRELDLRRGLATGEQLPAAQADRSLLLRLLQARPTGRRLCAAAALQGRPPWSRERLAVPADDHRARRDAGYPVGRLRPAGLQLARLVRGQLRAAAERRPRPAGSGRLAVSPPLSRVGSCATLRHRGREAGKDRSHPSRGCRRVDAHPVRRRRAGRACRSAAV